MTGHCLSSSRTSVVGVDISLVFVLTAVLEALLGGAVLLPLSAPGGGGSRGARRRLVAVAGGSKRHPGVEVCLFALQELPENRRTRGGQTGGHGHFGLTWPDVLSVHGPAPVGRYLDVQGHLNVKQVLVFPQMLGHLALQVPQLSVQLANSVLFNQIRQAFRLLLPSQHVKNLLLRLPLV